MLERRKIDFLCVQEIRWKGGKVKTIAGRYKVFHYGADGSRNGIGVVVKEDYAKTVLEAKRMPDRVMSLKTEIDGVILNVVSTYASLAVCKVDEKE